MNKQRLATKLTQLFAVIALLAWIQIDLNSWGLTIFLAYLHFRVEVNEYNFRFLATGVKQLMIVMSKKGLLPKSISEDEEN